MCCFFAGRRGIRLLVFADLSGAFDKHALSLPLLELRDMLLWTALQLMARSVGGELIKLTLGAAAKAAMPCGG